MNLFTKSLSVMTLLITLTTTWGQQSSLTWEQSPFFNTQFLTHYDLVRDVLIHQYGFTPISFPATDGIQLDGLLLQQPHARGTIIFSAGFFPGRKEGLAPILAMLPPHYNIVLFDARGHGTSEGSFWSSLDSYGKHEYKDVLGALQFTHEHIGGDIILFGICTGAFHTAHALIKLSQEKTTEKYRIKGCIFDSGFASFLEVFESDVYHIREKIVPQLLRGCADKTELKKTYLYRFCTYCITNIEQKLKRSYILPGLRALEAETNLSDKIQAVECPVLFIHALDDTYSPCATVQKLAQLVTTKTCWWIEHSEHALHMLKHKQEYREHLLSFLESLT